MVMKTVKKKSIQHLTIIVIVLLLLNFAGSYIFERFDHVSLLGTYNCFQHKGTVRELGKVFGLPKAEIDKLSSGNFLHNRLDDLAQLVLKYGDLIRGNPNHLGIHAGGIIISNDSMHNFSATHMPPKGFPTTQFDMVIAEDVGLYKFDILSQRGLGKIKDTLEIIRYNQPEKADFDIHDVKRFKTLSYPATKDSTALKEMITSASEPLEPILLQINANTTYEITVTMTYNDHRKEIRSY